MHRNIPMNIPTAIDNDRFVAIVRRVVANHAFASLCESLTSRGNSLQCSMPKMLDRRTAATTGSGMN